MHVETRYQPRLASVIVILTLSSLWALAFTGQSEQTISVQDPRPLAQVIFALEKQLGEPITYEDPVYINPKSFSDVTTAAARRPAPKGTVLVPRGGSLSFSYVNSSGDRSAHLEALKALLEAHRLQQPDAATFEIRDVGGVYHVVPSMFADGTGVLQHQSPLLDAMIAVTSVDAQGLEVIRMIASQVSQRTGRRLLIGSMPLNELRRSKVNLPGVPETAREALLDTFRQIGSTFSWQVFCVPGSESSDCYLNIHPITRKAFP